MPVIKLYYYPSFISLVPHILLEEIGAQYQLVFVNLSGGAHKRPDHLGLNPNGLIPILVQDELVLYESAAICLHLVDTHPGHNLAPPIGSSERAVFYKWLVRNYAAAGIIDVFAPKQVGERTGHVSRAANVCGRESEQLVRFARR